MSLYIDVSRIYLRCIKGYANNIYCRNSIRIHKRAHQSYPPFGRLSFQSSPDQQSMGKGKKTRTSDNRMFDYANS